MGNGILLGVLLSVVAAGCGGYRERLRNENVVRQDDELRKRAAFDLTCAEASVTLTPLTDTTRGVEGCGQKATYVRVESSWVMNTINGTVAPTNATASKGVTQ